jgi:hypothetical protein
MSLKTDIIDDVDTIFFSDDEFSVNVTYHEFGQPVKGIQAHVFHDEGDRGNVMYLEVIFRSLDIPNIDTKDTFTINGNVYKVLSMQVDSQSATTRVLLQKSGV